MKGTIKETLLGMGFSETEVKIFIYLGKRGPQKAAIITKQLKINKGQVYRTLKNLQKKGIVESTLEAPARFTAVPLESVIDSFVKSKREEVDQIEKTKNELLEDWSKIRQIELDSSLERFSVIEGEKKILHKISQMVKESKKELISITSVYGLLKGNQFGIFNDIKNHPLKNKIKFRFLTQLKKDDVKPIKLILKKIETNLNLKGRDPERSSSIFPRMVIKDREEILLFISDDSDRPNKNQIETVLCTNCQSIIKSFYGLFIELWTQASDLKKRIDELESGKPSSIMELIKDPEIAKKKYYDALDQGREEILIITSTKRLVEISKNVDLVRKWNKNGVSTKIMAPITNENLKATQTLLTCSEVRHIPIGYREITIIDGKILFQFNKPCQSGVNDCEILNLENVFFTNNNDYINQTKQIIFNIWKKTRDLQSIENESRIRASITSNFSSINKTRHYIMKKIDLFQNFKEKRDKYTENDVLEKFKSAPRFRMPKSNKEYSSIVARYFGTAAFSIIHPPKKFNLPDFIIGVWDFNKKSTFGAEKLLHIYLPIEKENRNLFNIVAIVQNNPNSFEFRKSVFKTSKVANNIHLVEKEKFNIFTKGNSLFVGWTVPIPLIPSKLVIPPSSVLFEGYGDVESGELTTHFPYSRRYHALHNTLDAFTTYFHPSSNYSGPGTEGYINREFILTAFPKNPISLK